MFRDDDSRRPLPTTRLLRRVVIVVLALGAGFTTLTPAHAARDAHKPARHATKHRRHGLVNVPLPKSARQPKTGVASFGPQPASARAPQSRGYYTYAVTPGARLSDHVAVINYSLIPLRLSVYPADGINVGRSGGLGLNPVGQRPRDAGAWIAIGTPHASGIVTVPARSASILPVRVRIPANAQPGDHTGGIVTQLTSTGQRKGERLKLQQRVAARVFIRVSGPLHPGLEVQQLSARYHGVTNPIGHGRTTVSYVVKNVGNVDLSGQQQLRISGWFGTTGKVAALADLPLLLPGGASFVSVTVPGTFPEVSMSAAVTIHPKVLPGAAVGTLPDYTGRVRYWATPWLLLLIILLVLVALAWRIERWRRARHPAPTNSQPRPTSHRKATGS